MKRLLKLTVKNDLFRAKTLPEVSNKRYYPSSKTIRNHISKARRKQTYSFIDQECLQQKITEWKKAAPSTNIFLRTKSVEQKTTTPNNDDVDDDSDSEEDVEDDVSGDVKMSTQKINYIVINLSKYKQMLEKN